MAKAPTTKASPVAVNFTFDCDAFFALTGERNSHTAELIRMVHAAIRPGVTHAAIAERLEAHNATLADSNNVRMTVGHYAQTAALALSTSGWGEELLNDDERLTALYRIRTTGTAESRRAMVAEFLSDTDRSFLDYVSEWAKATRAAVSASRSKADNAPGAKGKGKGKDDPTVTREAVVPASFGAVLAALDGILAGEADAAKLAEYAKALQLRVNRAKASATKATKAPATVAA